MTELGETGPELVGPELVAELVVHLPVTLPTLLRLLTSPGLVAPGARSALVELGHDEQGEPDGTLRVLLPR